MTKYKCVKAFKRHNVYGEKDSIWELEQAGNYKVAWNPDLKFGVLMSDEAVNEYFEEVFECRFCDKSFATDGELDAHAEMCHYDEIYDLQHGGYTDD